MEQVHVSVMLLAVVMFSCVCAGRFFTGRFEAIALGPASIASKMSLDHALKPSHSILFTTLQAF